MCRLLAYLGPPVLLSQLVEQPENSLVVQSYQPRHMSSGLLNADGFGFGWYDFERDHRPFRFRSTMPIWGEANLPSLGRYIRSGSVLATVRSATPGQAVDLSNCQPFCFEHILCLHNGFIENFRQTLMRPIRDSLDDPYYRSIEGSTDSEHLFAFILNTWHRRGGSLAEALAESIETVSGWATKQTASLSMNIVLSDGRHFVASRYSNRHPAPSLFYLEHDLAFPGAVIVASEPLFEGDGWKPVEPGSILSVGSDLHIETLDLGH